MSQKQSNQQRNLIGVQPASLALAGVRDSSTQPYPKGGRIVRGSPVKGSSISKEPK